MDIPAGLYIHIPWCIKKCPYCDFNSHQKAELLPEADYLRALSRDTDIEARRFEGRTINSVFIGGGTPSLLSGDAVDQLLELVNRRFHLAENCEITLEANPGAIDRNSFAAYAAAGVNRISLGAQSFDEQALKELGRVHHVDDINSAVDAISAAGFSRWNIDLMHGLPGQTVASALADLQQALSFSPTHLSWYQLTIETNTAFYSSPPALPDEDTLADIQDQGHELLSANGLRQYEVSAYASVGEQSRHNLNYWQFGDYAALGAGAHGKYSQGPKNESPDSERKNNIDVSRYWRTRQPDAFMAAIDSEAGQRTVAGDELVFEFMMNALRLTEGFESSLFEQRTGLALATIQTKLTPLFERGLLEAAGDSIRTTALGTRYLNDVVSEFI